MTKGTKKNIRLYQPLPIRKRPWEVIRMDFVFSLPRTQIGHDSIFLMVDRFSKMTHLTPYGKTNDVVHVVELFFREVVKLHGISKRIVSNQNIKFVGHFWSTLWKRIKKYLEFISRNHPQKDGHTKVVNRILGN